MIRILAILCVRNEAVHLRRCLAHLIEAGLDVHLIDNGSSDGTRQIAEEFFGHGLLAIEDLPWAGVFSLSDQLRVKQRIIAGCDHDWVVHVDADEWLCSPREGQSLRDGIAEADAAGYNFINFHEIVFVPLPGEDFYAPHYERKMRHYYFFQPHYPRLQRAWKRRAGLTNAGSGGHRLDGDVRTFPTDFILRHYIVLSEEHARSKYLKRTFSNEDLSKRWHRNRVVINEDNYRVKIIPQLFKVEDPLGRKFNLTAPLKTHFWEW